MQRSAGDLLGVGSGESHLGSSFAVVENKPEAGLLKAACPELGLEFAVEPIKGYASVPKGTVKAHSQNLAGLASERTYVFSRRPSCV